MAWTIELSKLPELSGRTYFIENIRCSNEPTVGYRLNSWGTVWSKSIIKLQGQIDLRGSITVSALWWNKFLFFLIIISRQWFRHGLPWIYHFPSVYCLVYFSVYDFKHQTKKNYSEYSSSKAFLEFNLDQRILEILSFAFRFNNLTTKRNMRSQTLAPIA